MPFVSRMNSDQHLEQAGQPPGVLALSPATLRLLLVALLAVGGLSLGGCVASMAASAVGAAVQASQPKRAEVTDDLRTPASEACTARASAEGQVHVIDAEQRRYGHVTVWGTVEKDGARRSFECRFDGSKVVGFTLRAIAAR